MKDIYHVQMLMAASAHRLLVQKEQYLSEYLNQGFQSSMLYLLHLDLQTLFLRQKRTTLDGQKKKKGGNRSINDQPNEGKIFDRGPGPTRRGL